uniref:Uncharacterized protein n=1 Tax=Manihot esculenta TaxID=3983 RepID=A0A2C9W1U9_MANES
MRNVYLGSIFQDVDNRLEQSLHANYELKQQHILYLTFSSVIILLGLRIEDLKRKLKNEKNVFFIQPFYIMYVLPTPKYSLIFSQYLN